MNHPFFKDFSNMKGQFQSFFGENFWKNFEGILQNQVTQYNIYQGNNELLVVFNIPGLNKLEDVHVFVNQNILEVDGNINLQFKDFKMIEEGIFQGRFKKEIELPYSVKSDRVDAFYQHGLLIIHLHRQIPDETKKNKVSIRQSEDE
ncbi:Hsp20/alpha crystallin family protein [Bacillus salitolerans]|uniref:Hsp20/alpha crystallin family protein n=1 Tax=Bacillus salitolerans TaxID=1437434 RepID=A0ABW4LRY1_9BACI